MDERRLAVVLDDGVVRIITTDPAELLAIARDTLTRPLTESECARFNFTVCPTLDELKSP